MIGKSHFPDSPSLSRPLLAPRAMSTPPPSAGDEDADARLVYAGDPDRSTPVASDDDPDARLVYAGDPDRSPPVAGNAIRTTKYNLLTFIPRNLYEQFRRVAYVYFFVLACLNQIPQLTVFGRETAFVPLGVVVVLTALKDGYEDWRRHRSDNHENNREAYVLLDGEFRPKRWKDIRVGEVVSVKSSETIPCDIVLLATSDPTGAAYIQTLNLDGESNLKTRYALQQTAALPPEIWTPDTETLIRCEPPNLNIYGFHGAIKLGDERRLPLGPTNIVLRGCEIKNTSWIVGVAVYTGMDTKVMLNCSGPPSKRSRLETRMNREIIILAGTMLVMCSLVASFTGAWLHDRRHQLDTLPYYRKADFSNGRQQDYLYSGIGLEVLFAFLKSVFSFQNFIPISLYISMEISRLTQSFMMTQDPSMYHEATNTKLQCRALNINEDLGQIKYVFSDKTGTLTENRMLFQCASIRGVDYSRGEAPSPGKLASHPTVRVDGQVWQPKMPVHTDPRLLCLLQSGKGTEEWMDAYNFFLAVAACNTIVPQVVGTLDPAVKLIDYQGESPDEQALVYAAAAYGFVLIERTSGHIVIDILGERQRFDILGLHEFDSDRKRMSVIVSCPDNTKKLFVKGADSSMFSVIDKSLDLDTVRVTEIHLHSYSSLGLRTLVIGMRELSDTDFEDWQFTYEKASTALSERVDLLRAVAVNVESNVHILGASGIEDKLQEGVPEAIESLRQAGIKVWVLTGDKQETAISIGYSCKLLMDSMTKIIINSHSRESCKSSLEDAISMSRELVMVSSRTAKDEEDRDPARLPLALIIDGPTLVHILETELEEELFKLATRCEVVLCCRVAPLQKAGIVGLIKKRTNDMTLSIGDGANDVSMIQMADVGIGISGQEGRQAVMASDFAMGQFRFLVPLLLVHGHWNYQRMGYMILYNFYRNAIFVLMVYWYMYYSAFSLFNPINEVSALLYSALYTALPTIMVGIYDQDLSRRALLKNPQLYGSGLRDESYNFKLFVLIMMDSIWQSLALFYVPFFVYQNSTIDDSSYGDIWILAMVVLVNVHLAMDVIRWNWILHLTIWGLTIVTGCCVIAIDASPTMPGYRAVNHIMSTGLFWLCLFCIWVSALLPRFAIKVFSSYLQPDDIQIAREDDKFGKWNEVSVAESATNHSTDLGESA